MSPRTAILDLAACESRIRTAQAAGRSVVLCHGCFDIVHPGHVRHLQQARAFGDLLIVSVSADRVVGRKGDHRPLIPQELRAENLAALDCVDGVVISAEETGVDLLERLRPDVYVKGREYEANRDPRFEAEKSVVEGYGGRVVFSSGDVVFSSTALIHAIEATSDPVTRTVRALLDQPGCELPELEGAIEAMRGRTVTVVGETVIDTYVACDRPEIAGESPIMSLRPLEHRSMDGGAAIIARHAAAMGARPILVTALPNGPEAEQMRLRLEIEGVEVRAVPVTGTIPEKQRFVVGTSKVMKLDLGGGLIVDETARRRIAGLAADAARHCDAAIVADFGLGLFSGPMLERLCVDLRRQVAILAGDVSGRRSNLLAFSGVDVIAPSEVELRSALNDWHTGLTSVVHRAMGRTGATAAIVTLGSEGCTLFEAGSARPTEQTPGAVSEAGHFASDLAATHVPALAAHAVDPLGCGDTLLTAATLARAGGASYPAATILGAIAAAHQVQRLGNAVIGASDLRGGVRRTADARIRCAGVAADGWALARSS